MNINFHPQASEEVVESASFYNSIQDGLGIKFLDALEHTLDNLRFDPFKWRTDEFGRRKYPLWKFPYVIIYRVKASQIFILAVAHTSRKPEYWNSRDI